MKKITVSNVATGLKGPAVTAGGFMLGIMLQKGLNKYILGSETAQGLMGEDTISALKQYASPAIVAAGSVMLGLNSKSPLMGRLYTGAAISGVTTVAMKMLWNKDLLGDLNGGILGSFLGEEDAEDFQGFGEIDNYSVEPGVLPGTAMSALDMPISTPATRDTPWEKETLVSGINPQYGMTF